MNNPTIIVRNDIRIQMLRFIRKRSLSLSTIATSTLVILTIISMYYEYSYNCGINVKLWLCGTAMKSFICTSIKLYAEATENRYICSTNTIMLQKVIEMLDVFGMVWFCIGNLLVFNSTNCHQSIPLIFYLSVSYIIIVYLLVICVLILRFSLVTQQTTNNNGNNHRNINIINNLPTIPSNIDWKVWLETHNSYEMKYSDWKHINNHNNHKTLQSQDHKTLQSQESKIINQINESTKSIIDDETVTCVICLIEYQSNDMITLFPCNGKHLFHSICLYEWLTVARTRGITCPCCRESPMILHENIEENTNNNSNNNSNNNLNNNLNLNINIYQNISEEII